MKRLTTLGIVMLLVLTCLGTASAKVTLKVAHFYDPMGGSTLAANYEWFQNLIAEFEKEHPDIRVEQEIFQWDQIDVKAMSDYRAGIKAHDVFLTSPQLMAQHKLVGDLADLTGFVENDWSVEDVEDFSWSSVWDSVELDEQLLALPLGAHTRALAYNRRMFEEVGLDPDVPPTTLDEQIEMGQKLTRDLNGDGKTDGAFDEFADNTSGWHNYLDWCGELCLFGEARFRVNVWNSLIYVVGNVSLSTPLAYAAAMLITSKLPQAPYFRGIYLLPWIIAPVVSTVLFRSLVDTNLGPIPRLIQSITGEQVIFLADRKLAMLVIILHSFWRSFPFLMLFLAAGMATIPNEIYEAAKVDGANGWQRFRNITFPMTRNHLGISLLTITMATLHDAETIYAFTKGGPGHATETMAVRLFKSSFINFDLNTGATVGVILIVISILFMAFYLKLVTGEGVDNS